MTPANEDKYLRIFEFSFADIHLLLKTHMRIDFGELLEMPKQTENNLQKHFEIEFSAQLAFSEQCNFVYSMQFFILNNLQ